MPHPEPGAITAARDAVQIPRAALLLWTHDARNPLSALLTNLHHVQGALGASSDPDVLEAAAECLALCTVLERYVSNLEILLHDGAARAAARVRLREVALEVARRVGPYASVVGQTVEVVVLGEPVVAADAATLRVALENLVSSAIELSPPGAVQIVVETREREGVLAVVDPAAAWTAEQASGFDLQAVGARSGAREGRPSRGLSLPAAAAAARAAGARLEIEPAEGTRAARVVLVVPLAPSPEAPGEPPGTRSP